MRAFTLGRGNRSLVMIALAVATLFTVGCPNGPDPPQIPTPTPTPPPQCDASRTGAAPRTRSTEDLRSVMSEERIVGGVEAVKGAWPWAFAPVEGFTVIALLYWSLNAIVAAVMRKWENHSCRYLSRDVDEGQASVEQPEQMMRVK